MNTRVVHNVGWISVALLICVFTLTSCDKSKVSASGTSIYANPDSIQFSSEHLRLDVATGVLGFLQSSTSSVTEIENAPDSAAAKKAYENAIDDFVDLVS
ncbi:MAG: hypothetical protein R2877_07060 [Bdellovibrionota bacterium]